MNWIRLELRKASNLRKEGKYFWIKSLWLNVVDKAIDILNNAVESGDSRQVEQLKRSFEQRIDELESFYLDHDDGL